MYVSFREGIPNPTSFGNNIQALLERFYDPTAGQVLVNGRDMKDFKISALRRCIGYVGQEPPRVGKVGELNRGI